MLGVLLAVSGCSGGPADGPVDFEDHFAQVEGGQDGAAYFSVPLCVQDGPASVSFDSVEVLHTSGTDQPVTVRVAWPDGPAFDRQSAGHGTVPAAYVPVEGASGEVGTCGANRWRFAVLAVVLPPTGGKPITVKDLRVDYQVAGESYSEVVRVGFTQCPRGTGPQVDAEGCQRNA